MSETPQVPAAESNAAMVGTVLLHTRKLESQLRALTGSDAAGMHDLADAAGSRLGDDLLRMLHKLAAVRNRAAHEETFHLTAEELAAFEAEALRAESALQALLPSAPATPHPVQHPAPAPRQLPPRPASTPRPAAEPPVPEEWADAPDLAVEQEFFAKLRRNLIWLGYLPLLGIGNFLRLLLESLLVDEWALCCGLFYLAAWPLTIQGIRETSPRLWQSGVVIFALTYLAALVRLVRQREKTCVPGWLLGIPLLHGIGMIASFCRRVPRGKFGMALLGIALCVLAIHWGWVGSWKACGWTLLGEWIVSIAASLLWPQRDA